MPDRKISMKGYYYNALSGSLKGFSPFVAFRNPVMFVVYLSTILMGLITFIPSLFSGLLGSEYSFSYYLSITVILIFTLWFASFSEALADAQGKANAASLRSLRTDVMARKIEGDAVTEILASRLHKGDMILLKEGDTVPTDAQLLDGAVVVNEAMMTGESEPQVKETGTDRDSILGGTVVLLGQARARVSNEAGSTFLDQMISLVEGANRQKTQNEIALTQLLVSLSIVLVVVIATLIPFSAYFGFLVDIGALIALLICLLPTTIGALLPSIRIAGVNRVVRYNVVAKSGKAVETAGDLDVLILDKTGTITVGNRVATAIIPAPGKEEAAVLEAAYLASALDTTPEGQSTMKLAYARGARCERETLESLKAVSFTAETRMSGADTPDGHIIRKGSAEAMARSGIEIPEEIARKVHDASMEGSTPLVLAMDNEVLGLIILQDLIKPGIDARIRELKTMGIKTIMVTGDNFLTAQSIAKKVGVDEFRAEAKPRDKLEIIKREQSRGHLIAMTGDGSNDAPALAQADVGLAMNSGTATAKEAANMVDLDSDPTKLIEIVALGKQLLITRGALTTFSVTNDVAKYFAIIPAMFASFIPSVALLNILDIYPARLAILSTLLFNALVIPMMIPVAMRGARFAAIEPARLLRRNMLVYGLGGLLSAFAGIKIVSIILGLIFHV